MSSSRWASLSRSRPTSTALLTPSEVASASRSGLRSVITTCRAPACRLTIAAMIPIGPAPVTSTSSPSIGNASAVCTALPNGSKIAATPHSTGCRCTQALVDGRATYSANAPSTCTPMPRVLMHRWRRPARQLRHRPQTRCPSPLTMSPTCTSITLEPTSTTSPENSCPTVRGGLTVPAAHSSQASICRSVPQIPVAFTATSTSPGPTAGIGTSMSSSPGPGRVLTSAFTGPMSRRSANGRRL